MFYTVKINKLRVHAYHGALEQERKVGNMFEVSVAVRILLNSDKIFEYDNLSDAIDYAVIADLILAEMAIPSSLLENVAYRIQHRIVKRYSSVIGGCISIAKLTPPISARMESAEVMITW
jgi:dihydroneopterin aldolase